MKTLYLDQNMLYDGTQLKPLWAYLNYKILGPSVVSWQGPCEIDFEHMVDGEDLNEGAAIRGSLMLHFVFEIFDRDLAFAVALQRLFVAILKDQLNQGATALKKRPLIQKGDDLYWGKRKLSISIATVSPVSQLIHLAVNISNVGTPVKTCSLQDFKIAPKRLAERVMELWSQEFDSILRATQKVRPVG
ncbi:MAG: DUF366 family protein [Bdellovibrionales bacterium]|nr:DUF366 family protein [Bdellovibrionales bacterium]